MNAYIDKNRGSFVHCILAKCGFRAAILDMSRSYEADVPYLTCDHSFFYVLLTCQTFLKKEMTCQVGRTFLLTCTGFPIVKKLGPTSCSFGLETHNVIDLLFFFCSMAVI